MKLNQARALYNEGVVIQFSIHFLQDNDGRHYQLMVDTKHGGSRELETFRGQIKRFKTLESVILDIESIQGKSVCVLIYPSTFNYFNDEDMPF